MSVYRIYVEKKPEFAVEANSLIGGIKSALGLENLTGLRVINRYDAEGLQERISTLQHQSFSLSLLLMLLTITCLL